MQKPKIIVWDLETLPCPRRIYKVVPSIGAWPGRTFRAELHDIISFGFKELGGKAQCINLWEVSNTWDTVGNKSDAALCQIIYDTLHDADEIVTHNGKRFDVKALNTKLMLHGFPPLPKMHHVDTKSILSKNLTLYSNSLEAAAQFFNLDVKKMKIENKWDLWYRMAFNEDTAKDRALMSEYCKVDVDTLEALYLRTRALHGTASVNKKLFSDNKVCPKCGSSNVRSNGWRHTSANSYVRYICGECNTWSRGFKKGDNLVCF